VRSLDPSDGFEPQGLCILDSLSLVEDKAMEHAFWSHEGKVPQDVIIIYRLLLICLDFYIFVKLVGLPTELVVCREHYVILPEVLI
jgi:hypothetical protein